MGKIPTSWGKDGKSPQIEGRSEYPAQQAAGALFLRPWLNLIPVMACLR